MQKVTEPTIFGILAMIAFSFWALMTTYYILYEGTTGSWIIFMIGIITIILFKIDLEVRRKNQKKN